MTKTEQCPKHGPYKSEFIIKGQTRDIYSRCPECEAEFEAQREKNAADEAAERRNEMIFKSGIPKRFKTCTLENFRPNGKGSDFALRISRRFADTFESLRGKGASLVFCGSPGTGKTHLACAIAMALIMKGVSARYTTVFKMMTDIKSTYHKGSDRSESSAINGYVNCDLLIIDEVGVQYGSEAEKILFYQIINGRYEQVLPTILISNLLETELTAFVGERCIDRMRDGGGAVVPFAWESYRK